MALTMKGSPSETDKQKPLPKKGARPARLIKVIDLGIHEREFKGEMKKPCQQVVLEFDLVDDLYTFDEEVGPQPIRVNTGYRFPLNVVYGKDGTPHEKSRLREFIRALDPTNECDYDLTKMMLRPCILNIVYNNKKDSDIIYANIDSAGPIPEIEGFTVNETSNEPFIFDIDNYTEEDWEELPEFIQEIVSEAQNFNKGNEDDIPF